MCLIASTHPAFEIAMGLIGVCAGLVAIFGPAVFIAKWIISSSKFGLIHIGERKVPLENDLVSKQVTPRREPCVHERIIS